MPRTKPFGSAPPAKKPRAAPLPTLLDLIVHKYGATLDAIQVMELLHIGHTTLNSATASGTLKCRKVGGKRIFTAIEVFKYLENQTKGE